MNPRVTALRHSGIVVRDLGISLKFYCDLLGLEVRSHNDESGDHLDRIFNCYNTRVTTVKMAASSGQVLVELLKFDNPTAIARGDLNINSLGPTHVAFTVENLDKTYEQLNSAGIKFNAPPQLSPDGKVKVTYCRDPEGNFVELVEELLTEI